MSDLNDSNGNGTASREPSGQPPLVVHSQYVRDLSFENPNAPASLAGQKEAPKIEVKLDVGARRLQEQIYELLLKIRREGTMSIEDHIENPKDSAIFQKYPKVAADDHILAFITDCLRLMVGGNMNPHELESLLEYELETHHQEALEPAHSIQKVADALPGFGIVAAVLGIIITMSIVGTAPPAEIGEKVA